MATSIDGSSSSAESILEHYGVKGMKWGVRKKRTPDQKRKAMAERHATRQMKDLQKLERIKTKTEIAKARKELSDYKRVNVESRSVAEKGARAVGKYAKNQGEMLVRNVAQETIQNSGREIIKSYTQPHVDVLVSALKKKG